MWSATLVINWCTTLGLHKAFANGSSGNIKSSKSQMSKMIKLGGFIMNEM